MASPPKRPRDPNQLAKLVTEIATGEVADSPNNGACSEKTTVGRSGGLKGGRARAKALSPERRAEIAAKAAAKRWAKDG